MKTFIYPGLVFLLLLQSCTIHSWQVTNNNVINSEDGVILGTGYGAASTLKIFGIGGLEKGALSHYAKQDLLHRYPLQKGQALTNAIADRKDLFVGWLVHKTTVYYTADIVDFRKDIDVDLEKKMFNMAFPVVGGALYKPYTLGVQKQGNGMKATAESDLPDVEFELKGKRIKGKLMETKNEFSKVRYMDESGKMKERYINTKEIIRP